MPIKERSLLTAADVSATPFVGPCDHTVGLVVDPSIFVTSEVDDNGYLKAGTPLGADGTLVGVAPDYVYGCVVESVKVAEGNTGALLDAAPNVEVAVATQGQVNRAVLEDLLGRALTANEIAGFIAAGSHMVLLD